MTRILSLILILLAVCALFFFFGPSHLYHPHADPTRLSDTGKWQEFVPPNKNFKIKFPAHPYHAVDQVLDHDSKTNRHYEVFIAATPTGTMYSINLISFAPEDISLHSNRFLENFIRKMLSNNPNNNVTSLEPSTFKGNDAVDFTVENGEITIDGKAFQLGNTVYLLSQTTKSEKQNKDEFQFFTDSFKLPNS